MMVVCSHWQVQVVSVVGIKWKRSWTLFKQKFDSDSESGWAFVKSSSAVHKGCPDLLNLAMPWWWWCKMTQKSSSASFSSLSSHPRRCNSSQPCSCLQVCKVLQRWFTPFSVLKKCLSKSLWIQWIYLYPHEIHIAGEILWQIPTHTWLSIVSSNHRIQGSHKKQSRAGPSYCIHN